MSTASSTALYRALTLAAYGRWTDSAAARRRRCPAGLRVERRAAHYRDSNALRSAPVDTMMGGHLALTWHLREGYSAYAALTRGYKAGGINPTAEDIPDALRSFDPEFVWNLETGPATRSADGRFDSRTQPLLHAPLPPAGLVARCRWIRRIR